MIDPKLLRSHKDQPVVAEVTKNGGSKQVGEGLGDNTTTQYELSEEEEESSEELPFSFNYKECVLNDPEPHCSKPQKDTRESLFGQRSLMVAKERQILGGFFNFKTCRTMDMVMVNSDEFSLIQSIYRRKVQIGLDKDSHRPIKKASSLKTGFRPGHHQ